VTWSIQGAALGCTINAGTGVITAGNTARAITIRATDATYTQHTGEGTLTLTAP